MTSAAFVVVAVFVLVVAVAIKFWSTVRLTARYQPGEYLASAEAQRLFLAGKVTPVIACAAIVVLAFVTNLWWMELPACMFFAVIAAGVMRIVMRRGA